MKEINFLKFTDNGRALDVGSYDGRNFQPLLDMGYEVTGVERSEKKYEESKERFPNVEILNEDIRDFKFEDDAYDVILCHNVFPFLSSKDEIEELLLKMRNSLKDEGLLWFTVFGPQDDWNTDVVTCSKEQVDQWVKSIHMKVHHESEEISDGASMQGEIKKWHIISYLLKK